jgi:predicted transcriptional regulator
MDKHTLDLCKTECPTCDGTGLVYSDDIRALCRRTREKLGLSQWDLAAIVGCPKSYISKFETGLRTYPETLIRLIVRKLQILTEAKQLEKTMLSRDPN